MLHLNDPSVRNRIFSCGIGLEKENLRVTTDGHMSHTPHPFPGDRHIVRDFCENQIEINTEVANSPEDALERLAKYDRYVKDTIRKLPREEILWPFSGPPLIQNDRDIPIAQFYGSEAVKTVYRYYLSDRYGRYKMTYCGIHYNYSFGEDLLQADYALSRHKNTEHTDQAQSGHKDFEHADQAQSGHKDFEHADQALSADQDYKEYKNELYMKLARACAVYSWIIVALTAASPLLDGSFVKKDAAYQTVFNGMASSRCSELGYWNHFTPVLDYGSVDKYVESIRFYVDKGLLKYPSELYYPIRLKPRGAYSLESLQNDGIDHIELRMIDLNPLTETGIDIRDVRFIQLFLIWAACVPEEKLDIAEQVCSTQNFKNAAHFDLKTVKIIMPNGSEEAKAHSLAYAGMHVIGEIEKFYEGYPEDVLDVIRFEKEKFTDIENRYAWKILNYYGDDYVRKGLEEAMKDRD